MEMKNIEKYEYLPIGSVVSINNSKEKLMIIGYRKETDDETYDYMACIFPIGVKSSPQATLAFNHVDINEIYYIGYKTKSYGNLNKILQISKIMEDKINE